MHLSRDSHGPINMLSVGSLCFIFALLKSPRLMKSEFVCFCSKLSYLVGQSCVLFMLAREEDVNTSLDERGKWMKRFTLFNVSKFELAMIQCCNSAWLVSRSLQSRGDKSEDAGWMPSLFFFSNFLHFFSYLWNTASNVLHYPCEHQEGEQCGPSFSHWVVVLMPHPWWSASPQSIDLDERLQAVPGSVLFQGSAVFNNQASIAAKHWPFQGWLCARKAQLHLCVDLMWS